jgi:signal transduction histidine kinase
MGGGIDGGSPAPDAAMAARLHDIAAGLAVGIGLLKELSGTSRRQGNVGIEVLESVLAEVKQLSHLPQAAHIRSRRLDLASGLREEATRLGVELELELTGDADWLTFPERELLRLASREAIRNVRRHSGTAKCQLRIDLSVCPYMLRARDWGAGIDPTSKAGNGIERLRDLAASLGGELAIGSQPGMGTVLVDQAKNNSMENFKLVFEPKFINTIVTRMDANQSIFKQVLDDQEFQDILKDVYVRKMYSRLRSAETPPPVG